MERSGRHLEENTGTASEFDHLIEEKEGGEGERQGVSAVRAGSHEAFRPAYGVDAFATQSLDDGSTTTEPEGWVEVGLQLVRGIARGIDGASVSG